MAAHCVTQELPQTAVSMKQEPAADMDSVQSLTQQEQQDEELASHKVKVEIEADMDQNWNIKQEWLEAWEEPVHHDYDLSILKVETKDEITTEDHSISLGERSGAFSNASTAEEKSGPGKCSCRESLYSVCDCMSPSGEKMYEKINDSSELPSESGADTGLQLCISEDHEEDDIEHCNLNHHLRINVSDIDHRCSECGICFKSKYILRQHLKLHYEKQINKCEECGKCFNSKSILRQHLKLHYEKKIHKCEECGKCFVRSYTLKQHLLIHTGVKDYKCPTCGNSFMYNT